MIPNSNEIRFEVCTLCNYNCVMCARNSFIRKKEVMSFDTFKLLIDKLSQYPNYHICTFSGFGEPTIDPELSLKVKYAKSLGYRTLLLTNGSLLTNKLYDKIAEDIDSIRVSLYAANDSTYKKVHGTNKSLSEVKENIDYILNNKKCEIIINYLVIDNVNNNETFEWTINWENKVDTLEVWKPHNWGNNKNFRKVQEEKQLTCGRLYNGPLQIQVDGTVNVCCFDTNGETTVGDLKTETLEEIFTSEKFKTLLKYHKDNICESKSLICANCDQRNKTKDGIMLYTTKKNVSERVNQFSTSYKDILT